MFLGTSSPDAAEPWPAAHEWFALAHRIFVCSRILREVLADCTAGAEVSEGEVLLLWTCRMAGPPGVGQKELARAMAVSPAHVSGLVERLREKGYLRGQRDPADRRRQCWQLTADGKAALRAVLDELSNRTRRLQRELGVNDTQSLTTGVDQLIATLRGEPRPAVRHRGAA